MNDNYDSKQNVDTNEQATLSNCHRADMKKNNSTSAAISETDSDQDSANSKYVVTEDNRERRDGPGGN